jgi:hypothetical protein
MRNFDTHLVGILRVISDVSNEIIGEIQPAPPVIKRARLEIETAEVGLLATARIDPELPRDQLQVVMVKVQGGLDGIQIVDEVIQIMKPDGRSGCRNWREFLKLMLLSSQIEPS